MIGTIITILSLCVGAGGLGITFATFQKNSHKSVREETKENVEIHAGLQSQIDIVNTTITSRLDTIDDGIRDLKAEGRNTRNDVSKYRDDMHDEIRKLREDIHDDIDDVRISALHAVELAEAAHRRLDRLGAEPDALVHKIEGEKNVL